MPHYQHDFTSVYVLSTAITVYNVGAHFLKMKCSPLIIELFCQYCKISITIYPSHLAKANYRNDYESRKLTAEVLYVGNRDMYGYCSVAKTMA